MGIVQDFKAFALKGNVVDLAVGVVTGGAFGKIVSSLVSDVIMPPLALITGGINFTDMKLVLREAMVRADGKALEAITLNYGNFIQHSVDFFLIALSIFMVIQAMGRLRAAKPEEVPVVADATPTEVALLSEIRDLLKQKA
ncbi:large-conductance mechanosensitive channel protein MscL [Vampirovibrio chlorellavorus]|uniref:large-conductance mechanosensitive channel protein MscL n=1 Tax=Vampirovibrio chlorellavorus TaxID=758823 RepID=UPI0026EA61D2|nr:large-conductance mechanosensitive channel protein MscL [Vampirovibrio chlorellavorus]